MNCYGRYSPSGSSPEALCLPQPVDGGRIWLHPDEDGTTVDIHLFDDTEDRDFTPARSRLHSHLMHELNAPHHGKHEPYTPFIGNDRMNIRINFQYLQD